MLLEVLRPDIGWVMFVWQASPIITRTVLSLSEVLLMHPVLVPTVIR